MAWHGPDTRNDIPSTYAADVFSYILSQKSSKLQQDLVNSGLAFYSNLNYQTCKYTGPINFFVVPHPAKIKEAMQKVEEHIAQWDNDSYFTDEELETAKRLLEISDARGRESTSNFLHTVTYWWASANIEYYTDYVANLKKVSRADIRKYVTQYIKGKPRLTGILTSPQERPALESTLSLTK